MGVGDCFPVFYSGFFLRFIVAIQPSGSLSPRLKVQSGFLPVEDIGVNRIEVFFPLVEGPLGHDPVCEAVREVNIFPHLVAVEEWSDDPCCGDEFAHVQPQRQVVGPEVGHDVLMLKWPDVLDGGAEVSRC